MQDDAAALGRVEERYGYEDAARVMGVAKNLSVGDDEKGKVRERFHLGAINQATMPLYKIYWKMIELKPW